MTSPLGGRPTKDQVILDGFNPKKKGGLTRRDKALLAQQKRSTLIARKRLKDLAEAGAKELVQVEEDLLKRMDQVREEVGISAKDVEGARKDAPAPDESDDTPPTTPAGSDPDADEKSAHKMLADLRYAYSRSIGPTGKKGKARLVELLENDSEFKFAVKELVKVDTALLAAKIRNKEDESGAKIGQQNFFVVLKGLDDGPVKALGGVVDKTVDMKQITRAMNPDENSYEPEYEEVAGRNDAPEMLLGRVDNNDEDNEDEGGVEDKVDAIERVEAW